MEIIAFTVYGLPVAQPRQRLRVAQSGGRVFARNYTPTKAPVNAFKAAVQLAAATEYSGAPLAGPVRLTLDFILPRPKSRTRKRGGNPSYPHASKPDLDNLCKSVKDALTKLIWHDDSQVAVLVASKRVASGSEQPRVEVSIMEQHA